MAGPNIPVQGTPGVFDGRNPTLIPNTYPVYVEGSDPGVAPVVALESPQDMETLHPTGGGMTLMIPTNNFEWAFDHGGIQSFYYGRTYPIDTVTYNEMVTAGMPVTA